jgi:hypothetical protein
MCHTQVTAVKAYKKVDDPVLQRAKTIFLKRNWTLYRWLHPDCRSKRLDAVLSAVWDALPIAEKHHYISGVTVCIIISVLFHPFTFIVKEKGSFAHIIQYTCDQHRLLKPNK